MKKFIYLSADYENEAGICIAVCASEELAYAKAEEHEKQERDKGLEIPDYKYTEVEGTVIDGTFYHKWDEIEVIL